MVHAIVESKNIRMANVSLPNVVNEHTKLCRICLSAPDELYSINGFGKICDKTVKINDLLSECTSIEVSGIESKLTPWPRMVQLAADVSQTID